MGAPGGLAERVCRAGAPTGVGAWPGHGLLPCETVHSEEGRVFHGGFRLDARGGAEEPVPCLSGHRWTSAVAFQTRVLCDPVVPVLGPRKDPSVHVVALSPCEKVFFGPGSETITVTSVDFFLGHVMSQGRY